MIAEIILGSEELISLTLGIRASNYAIENNELTPKRLRVIMKGVEAAKKLEKLTIIAKKSDGKDTEYEKVFLDTLPQCVSLKRLKLSNILNHKRYVVNYGIKGEVLLTIIRSSLGLERLSLGIAFVQQIIDYNNLSSFFNVDPTSDRIRTDLSKSPLKSLHLSKDL